MLVSFKLAVLLLYRLSVPKPSVIIFSSPKCVDARVCWVEIKDRNSP